MLYLTEKKIESLQNTIIFFSYKITLITQNADYKGDRKCNVMFN